jgi:RNA polymerase sigma-70 factor (ECF subfamily)
MPRRARATLFAEHTRGPFDTSKEHIERTDPLKNPAFHANRAAASPGTRVAELPLRGGMPMTMAFASDSPRAPRHSAVVAHDLTELKAGLASLVPELRARAMRLAADRTIADDLVQDTIERALRFADQYERGTNLRAWAYQILFSVFVTRYRRARRERNALRILASDPLAWTMPPAFGAPEAETSLTPSTREQLDALPQGFRAVLVLVDLEQHSYREAATALGVPVGTVMSRLHRGRKLLASKLVEKEAA